MTTESREWTVEDSIGTYNIDRWGLDYFSINDGGNVSISPLRERGATIDIMEVLRDASDRGLQFPMVVRFQDLLRDRVEWLNRSFNDAIAENKFGGRYYGVFPIKVNQLREVVEEIADAGQQFHYGLEAGSKPELFSALATHKDPESLIICNGYKDSAFIKTATIGRKLGKKIILIAEKLEEIKAILEISRENGVQPWIGVRIRLAAKSTGIWATSGGESAKFGLSTLDLMEAVEFLRAEGALDALRMVHFHIGSQIPDIQSIKKATREATRYYAKLRKIGFENLEYIDVGGGLGVDYDGSRTLFHSSTNYSLDEYAGDCIFNIKDVCDEEGVAHPNIVSESGRAIVAHHSVLVVQVFGAIEKTKADYDLSIRENDHKWIKQLAEVKEYIRTNPRVALHDALQIKEESQNAFELGILDLYTKARIETFYWAIVEEISDYYSNRSKEEEEDEPMPEEISELVPHLADQYLCNFSVFQSLLDHWALGQIFPIMPIHRLNEKPTMQGTLCDITCDSDGKISRFADIQDVRKTLPLHPLNANEPYYIAVFMTGAYQDIMGDLHNLFGRVNEAHVFLDPDEDSGFYIEETISGNTISQVLELTQYYTNDLVRSIKEQINDAIRNDRLKPNEGMRLLAEYEKGLTDHTYLTFSNGTTAVTEATTQRQRALV
ncbi:MAG: biosynthetic arginine decarboxylase [Bacteroidetes bacterium]|nr:biosynthetic arginine decarboxylase [Bacteroidota bacterium]